MEKIDFKRELKDLYSASAKKVAIDAVPGMNFLMVVALSAVRFEPFKEGKSAQIMHIGPFSAEGPTIEKLHLFISESGSRIIGKHHEIYLSDIRRAAPERWKTIIRQPMT